MKGQIGRVALAVALSAVAVVLLVGGASAGPDAQPSPRVVAADAPPPATIASRYPLAAGPTAEEIQLVVYERAYSECASTDFELLASKYKAAEISKSGVAAVVGRAWASYFRAGRDAIRDGRDGCLLGQRDRGS